MSAVEERLAELDLALPPVPAPAAAYLPAVRTGPFVYTSGQIPTREGQLLATGKVGAQVSADQAYDLARVCAVNALAAVKALIGDLDQVEQVVKVVGFVAADPGFTGMSQVVNGASDLLVAAFGAAGAHARSAVGVAVLPLDAPVEVELVVRVR